MCILLQKFKSSEPSLPMSAHTGVDMDELSDSVMIMLGVPNSQLEENPCNSSLLTTLVAPADKLAIWGQTKYRL